MFTGERPNPAKHPRPEFARMLTSDPQFARATVNLLWSEMFGVGIVEPVFAFDLARLDPKNPPPAPWALQPTHPELLEALGQYFRDNNYSLRSVLKLIAKSNAYQLSSQFPGEWKADYAPYFARKFVRRLKAEEVYDSLVTATNVFTEIPIRGTDVKVKLAAEAYSPDEFIRNINDPISQGDSLLPGIVRADEPAILGAEQRRRDHPGGAAHEQPARSPSDPRGGGELPGGPAEADHCPMRKRSAASSSASSFDGRRRPNWTTPGTS